MCVIQLNMSTTIFIVYFFFSGDMLYIPQYWWHIVRSYDTPNIAVNMWFGLFSYEDKFLEAGISEDTDVVKVSKIPNKII